MTENINATILTMVKTFKTGSKFDASASTNNYNYKSPALKRSLGGDNSSSSDDDLQTPVKKQKPNSADEYDMMYVGSPREIRRLRADLVEARNTIRDLESRISQMHGVRKQMQLLFDDETQCLRRQQEYDRKSITDLEAQLQTIRKREIDLKNELATVRNDYNELKLKTAVEIDQLEKSLSEVKEESRHLDEHENVDVPFLKQQIKELRVMLEAAEEDAEAQKKLAEELEKRLSEKNAVERELALKENELQKAKLQIEELLAVKETYQEFQEQAIVQAHKINNYIEMQKENERLKEENIRFKDEIRNKLLLEEEVHDLRNRLVKFKEYEQKITELQLQQMQMEVCLNEWRAVARGVCESTDTDSSLPHLLRTHVERLQQQEINLTSEKVDLEAKWKAAAHDAKVYQTELEKVQKLLTELKNNIDHKQNLIHRIQKKLLLVSRERDSYRLQLDSYEKDLTVYINPLASGNTPTNNTLANQKERIDNLERIVEGYRDMVHKLESDLAASSGNSAVPVKMEQLNRIQEEVEQLRMENERLREKKDELEVQLESYLVGHDTLQGGQVYHLQNNPLSECITQREKLIANLEQENEKLKRKIKDLQEGIETSKLGDLTVCPQEIQALKEQLQAQEAQTAKLKEYFRSSMQEFRNVIYMLLGYKIDRSRTSNSLYKLRSMYAESPEDNLCFQINEEGNLSLLETEYSATLDNLIQQHLTQNSSIPTFLSALTIELFNSSTKTFSVK